MSTEPDYMKWVAPLDNLVFQAWYRVLSFVSLHAPVDEVYEAAKYIAANKRGGDVYWVVKNYLGRWENFDVNPPHGIKMTIWISGFPRGKNTILSRVGWWSLYLFDTAKRIQRSLTDLATAGFFERQAAE